MNLPFSGFLNQVRSSDLDRVRNAFYSLPGMILIFLILTSMGAYAQVSGRVTDENNNPLPYATVYIEGTSSGTVCNAEGVYELDVTQQGDLTLVFSYVGYRHQTVRLNYTGQRKVQNVSLLPDDNILNGLVITSDREDPSYAIIRKAIAKRDYYKKQFNSYSADLYVKGVVKLTDTPKKILGEEIGTLNGILDTAGQGIVYLSESKSKFYFLAPDKTREVMISSVSSGTNSLFTANQFNWASFDLYTEYLNFSRSIISPIADNAFAHYRYALEQVTVDNQGRMINKIKIIPRYKSEPLLQGYIYITEDLWNIYSADIIITGPALKNTYLDTIEVKQVFVPVEGKDKWRMLSQVFSFKAGLLGFKLRGSFTYVFSGYDTKQDTRSVMEGREVFRVEKDALLRDSAFWNNVRPIPLTDEEQRDYIRKDSLMRLWNSKPYMDSIDRKNNKFSILKFLTGYTYNKSYKKTSLTYPSPLSSFRFNAVEGFKLSLDVIWEKTDTFLRSWIFEPAVQYGFSDNKFKAFFDLERRFDNFNQGYFNVGGGRRYIQFDPRQPIAERGNSWASLWSKFNSIRLYQSEYLSAGFRREIFNGFFLNLSTGLEKRSPLHINSNYSFRFKNDLYDENIPRPDLDAKYYRQNSYWKSKIGILIRPAQKYSTYPNMKVRDVSDWPNIRLEYEAGLPLEASSGFFNKFTLQVRDIYVNARLLGYFSYNVEFGTSLGKAPTFFGDFFHPIGNQVLMPIAPDLASFNLMPYYAYSTDRNYIQVNFRHHFNGFIMDKIPLMRKTSFKEVLGFSALDEPINGRYLELFTGLENFRLGPLHLFDLDYTWSFDKKGFRDHGLTVRLSVLLNN